jgi:hypothetical protein
VSRFTAFAVSIAEPAADGHEPVPRTLHAGVLGRLADGVVGRFDVHAVEDLRLDAGTREAVRDTAGHAGADHARVGDDQDASSTPLGQLEADLVRGARAELHRGRAPREDRLIGPAIAVCHRRSFRRRGPRVVCR